MIKIVKERDSGFVVKFMVNFGDCNEFSHPIILDFVKILEFGGKGSLRKWSMVQWQKFDSDSEIETCISYLIKSPYHGKYRVNSKLIKTIKSYKPSEDNIFLKESISRYLSEC